jgi:hypothetical protein
MKTVYLIAPWFPAGQEFSSNRYRFTSCGCVCSADGLLVWWKPHDLLFSYAGPKGFFCPEPVEVPSVWQEQRWVEITRNLDPAFVFRPGHPCRENQVPHDTHHVPLTMNRNQKRKRRAVAVVSNSSADKERLYPSIRVRNALCCSSHVDLYGNPDNWKTYRRNWLGKRMPPANYRGAFPGNWTADELIQLFSEYKVVVCLESSCELNYFTEKFVNAVRGGAVPVYHAHESVRHGILSNAAWIDPADYGFDSERTLQAALNADLLKYQEVNDHWLKSEALEKLESSRVRDDICDRMFTLDRNLIAPSKNKN